MFLWTFTNELKKISKIIHDKLNSIEWISIEKKKQFWFWRFSRFRFRENVFEIIIHMKHWRKRNYFFHKFSDFPKRMKTERNSFDTGWTYLKCFSIWIFNCSKDSLKWMQIYVHYFYVFCLKKITVRWNSQIFRTYFLKIYSFLEIENKISLLVV